MSRVLQLPLVQPLQLYCNLFCGLLTRLRSLLVTVRRRRRCSRAWCTSSCRNCPRRAWTRCLCSRQARACQCRSSTPICSSSSCQPKTIPSRCLPVAMPNPHAVGACAHAKLNPMPRGHAGKPKTYTKLWQQRVVARLGTFAHLCAPAHGGYLLRQCRLELLPGAGAERGPGMSGLSCARRSCASPCPLGAHAGCNLSTAAVGARWKALSTPKPGTATGG